MNLTPLTRYYCGSPHAPGRRRVCYCGRKVSTLPDNDGRHCAEHDTPMPRQEWTPWN